MVDRSYTEDLADIAAICGEDVADELLAKLPGIEIKVPLHWREDHPLALIDRDKADCIIRHLSGNKFYIPTRTDRTDNRAEALKLHATGLSTIEIALKLHVSERYIRMILSDKRIPIRRKCDDRQIDLEEYLDGTTHRP